MTSGEGGRTNHSRMSEGGGGYFRFPPWGGMDLFWNDPFYKHQHFTNINITNINISNINIANMNIANMNIASINIHHFKEQKFVVFEVFQYSFLRALKLDVEF